MLRFLFVLAGAAVLLVILFGVSIFGLTCGEQTGSHSDCPPGTERVSYIGDATTQTCKRPDGTKHGPSSYYGKDFRHEGTYVDGEMDGEWVNFVDQGGRPWIEYTTYEAGKVLDRTTCHYAGLKLERVEPAAPIESSRCAPKFVAPPARYFR